MPRNPTDRTAEPSRWLTPPEFADRLGLHVESVRRGCREGTYPGKKIGGRWYLDGSVLEPSDSSAPASRAA